MSTTCPHPIDRHTITRTIDEWSGRPLTIRECRDCGDELVRRPPRPPKIRAAALIEGETIVDVAEAGGEK